MDIGLTAGQFALLLSGLLCLFFGDVLAGGQSFYYRDFGIFGHPLAAYHRECFWRGEIPLWNPLNNCGLPFLAQWNTLVAYPGSLIYLLLPLPWSLNFFCLAHLFLAGLGMYFLARHWSGNGFAAALAGLTYALNGLVLHSLMWPNNIAAFAWLPFVLWLGERAAREGGRRLLVAAAAGTMQMLAGAPEIIALTWLLLLGLVGGQCLCDRRPRNSKFKIQNSNLRPLTRLGLMALLVAGLAAIQLLPFFELLSQSQRLKGFDDSSWAMPAWGWGNFLVPLFRCFQSMHGVFGQNSQQWTSSYYLPLGAVALALVALWQVRGCRVWLLGTVLLAGLLLSLGNDGLLHGWLKRLVPLTAYMRYPIKFVVLVIITAPLLAALSAGQLANDASSKTGNERRGLLLAGLLVLAGVVAVLIFSKSHPYPGENWPATFQNGGERIFFLLLTVAGFYVLTGTTRRGTRQLLQIGLLMAVGADGLTHMPRQNPTVPAAAFTPGLAELEPRPLPGHARALISREASAFLDYAAVPDPLTYYVGLRRALFSNCNLLDDVPKVDGFFSLYLREEAEVEGLFYSPKNQFPAGLADFLGVSHISKTNNYFQWSARTTAMPLFSGGQRPIAAGRLATLRGLNDPGFDPRQVVFVPAGRTTPLTFSDHSPVRTELKTFRSHKITAEVAAEKPGLVVVAQAFYPAWHAYVDGHPTPTLQANHAFLAVEVPAGAHTLALVYEDRMFQTGAVISAMTLLACLGLAWRGRKTGGNFAENEEGKTSSAPDPAGVSLPPENSTS